MRKIYFSLFLLFCISCLYAQPHDHFYKLYLNDSLQTIRGHFTLRFNNSSADSLKEIYLHLPPRSLEWKESLLHQQFIDFQDVNLYYSSDKDRGYIEILNLDTGRFNPFTIDYPELTEQNGEFIHLPLDEYLASGETVELGLTFEIKIADAKFFGTGYDGKVYRLVNWLPRAAMLDTNGWQLNSVTYQNDIYQQFDNFYIDLNIPVEMEVATNGISLKDEDAPFSNPDNSRKELRVIFEKVTSPQLFISSHFHIYPLGENKLYLTKEDVLISTTIAELQRNVDNFYKDELGDMLAADYDILLLDDKIGEFQSDRLLTLNYPKDLFVLSSDLAHARAEQLFRYKISPNGFKEVWLSRGLPYFYKYRFIETYFPEKKWLPFSNSFIGKFFDLDEFSYDYQNQFIYLYLARQGLDQPMSTPADSLSRLNYEAIAQAKAFLGFSHLAEYMGPRDFKRSMRKYYFDNYNKISGKSDLRNSLKYYHFADLNWFFDELVPSSKYNDYKILDFDYCPTVTTTTIKNNGGMAIPFSISGFKDGKLIHTDWFPGHSGTKSLQLYHANFDKLVINHHQNAAEYSLQNNTYNEKAIFKKAEPLRLQLWNGFENPDKTQIFWMPSAGFNAYDKLLLGISFYNKSLVNKPFEYVLGPEYSTGTGSLTGYASMLFNFTPETSPFHRITTGLFTRYRHYDEGLAYFRISPSLNFYFRRNYAESDVLQKLRLRGVSLQRELPREFDDVPNSISNASYTIFTTNYLLENINVLHPFTLNFDFQYGDQFSKLSVAGDFRWMLPNKRWLIWRNFGGIFLHNSFAKQGLKDNYYSYGLSGTRDYLFDYELIGRSDESGIWSRQFFVTDGGFKSQTDIFADEFIFTSNLTVPIWTVFGVFGDIGIVDKNQTLYWDYGGRIAIFTDFLEFYFPFQNQDVNFLKEEAYYKNIRFVLNADLSEIIGRLRRGYY